MVYKLSSPKAKSKWSLFAWLLIWTVPLSLLVNALVLWYGMELSWPEVAVAFLATVVVAALLMYGVWSRSWRQNPWDTFVTVTEAGLLREVPHLEQKLYVAWQEVRRVKLCGAMMVVQMKDDIALIMSLDGLSAARRAELFHYCREHVGKVVPAEKQIQPPAWSKSETPRVGRASVKVREEAADYLVSQQQSFLVWCHLFFASMMLTAVPVMIWGNLYMEDGIGITPAVVGAVAFFLALRSYLHPGRKLRKWIHLPHTHEVHVTPGYVMVVGASWAVVPRVAVDVAVEKKNSYIYGVRAGGVIAVDKSGGPLDYLPLPQPQRRRWGRGLFFLVLVPVMCWATLGCWMLSGMSDDDDDPGSELAAYVEEMTPVHGFPGGLTYCSVYHLEEERIEVVIAGWENEMTLEMIFSLPETPQSDD